jgi:hypothetical protein
MISIKDLYKDLIIYIFNDKKHKIIIIKFRKLDVLIMD